MSISFSDVPALWRFNRLGKTGKTAYPVTVTMNVKHPQYKAINCPDEWKYHFNNFLDISGYKHTIDGVLEYHKNDGALRKGGLHMHGLAYYNNPPKDNKNNLFHFHLCKPDSVKGIIGYIKYSRKDLQATDERFAQLCQSQPSNDNVHSPTIPRELLTRCLFPD